MVRMAGGRLFHARDAVTGKARSPRVDRCTDGTTSIMVVDERRWRRPSTSAVWRTLSARYIAALMHWDTGMPERRDGIESVPGRIFTNARWIQRTLSKNVDKVVKIIIMWCIIYGGVTSLAKKQRHSLIHSYPFINNHDDGTHHVQWKTCRI